MTPLGKLIHDSNSAIGNIKSSIFFTRRLQEKGTITEQDIRREEENILAALKRLELTQDEYYKWAKDQGQKMF